MKKILNNCAFILLVLFFASIKMNAQDLKRYTDYNFKNGSEFKNAVVIDSLDSVFFDLTNLDVAGNIVGFPVFLVSDDTINTLDFKFYYNHINLLFDSVQNIDPCLDQTLYFEVPFDSAVKFNSNSFFTYPNYSPIVMVWFTIVSGSFQLTDIYNPRGILNGIVCPIKILTPPPASLNENIEISNLKIYPIPTKNSVFIAGDNFNDIQLLDINGKEISSFSSNITFNKYEVNVSSLPSGVYVLKVKNDNALSIRRIIIE